MKMDWSPRSRTSNPHSRSPAALLWPSTMRADQGQEPFYSCRRPSHRPEPWHLGQAATPSHPRTRFASRTQARLIRRPEARPWFWRVIRAIPLRPAGAAHPSFYHFTGLRGCPGLHGVELSDSCRRSPDCVPKRRCISGGRLNSSGGSVGMENDVAYSRSGTMPAPGAASNGAGQDQNGAPQNSSTMVAAWLEQAHAAHHQGKHEAAVDLLARAIADDPEQRRRPLAARQCACSRSAGSTTRPTAFARRCGSGPSRRRFTTTWASSWPAAGGARRPRRSIARRSGSSPTSPTRTTTWATPSGSTAGSTRRSPATARRSGCGRRIPRRTITSAWRCGTRGSPPRRSPLTTRRCGCGRPIPRPTTTWAWPWRRRGGTMRPSPAISRRSGSGRMMPRSTSTWAAPCQDLNRHDEAVAAFTEAIRRRPENARAHKNLGIAYSRQNKFDEAVRCYREAIRLRPDYADAHNDLGIALARQNKYADAAESYRQAIGSPAQLRRGAQQPGQRPAEPGTVRRGARGVPPGDRAEAELCRRLQQPGHRLCRDGPVRRGGGAATRAA